MGTRDDEYDYLFKGAPCGVQTGEVAVATGGPKPCYRNRELRVEARTSTGPIRAGSRRKPGQVEFARLRALVRSGEEREARRGLRTPDAPGRGRGLGGVGPEVVGEAVGAGRPEGRGFPGFGGRTALKAGL
jgi:hypothetical protein